MFFQLMLSTTWWLSRCDRGNTGGRGWHGAGRTIQRGNGRLGCSSRTGAPQWIWKALQRVWGEPWRLQWLGLPAAVCRAGSKNIFRLFIYFDKLRIFCSNCEVGGGGSGIKRVLILMFFLSLAECPFSCEEDIWCILSTLSLLLWLLEEICWYWEKAWWRTGCRRGKCQYANIHLFKKKNNFFSLWHFQIEGNMLVDMMFVFGLPRCTEEACRPSLSV